MDTVAVVGAITGVLGVFLGGLSLFVQWRAHLENRSKLVVSAHMGLAQNVTNPELHPYLSVTLRNAGRRLVRIHDIWVQAPIQQQSRTNPNSSKVVFVEERIHMFKSETHPPLVLEEHESRDLRWDPVPNDVAKYLSAAPTMLKVQDALGNTFEAAFVPCHVPDVMKSN